LHFNIASASAFIIMYTGIITGCFSLKEVIERKGLNTFIVELDDRHMKDLQIGASVSMDGVCLTVTKMDDNAVYFDAMQETLNLTTLGTLKTGDKVHIERSAKAGAEVGGHPISGHVDGKLTVKEITFPENNCVMTLEIPEKLRPYVFNKGFVSIAGCSLTVTNLDKESGTFQVWLIPETLRVTKFGDLKPGDQINLEIDRQTQVVVDTVRSAVMDALKELKLK